MTHPAYSFLSQNEIDAANRAVAGMRKAADDFHFHLTVLKTFALNMQARVAFIEASSKTKPDPLKIADSVSGEAEVVE